LAAIASRFSRVKRSRCANHQTHDLADHRPPFARRLQEDEVVDGAREQHQQQHHEQHRRDDLQPTQLHDPASRQVPVGDQNLHG
jgi:hypothetical protein